MIPLSLSPPGSMSYSAEMWGEILQREQQRVDELKQYYHDLANRLGVSYIQWNLGIRDTHGTVKNCPEF